MATTAFAPTTAVTAQVPHPIVTGVADSLGRGAFHGTLIVKANARDPDPPAREVSGTASWGFERDTLDWRRKIVIRLAFAGPEPWTIAMRTADSVAPSGVMRVASYPDSHVDPRFFTAEMSAREGRRWQPYIEFDTIADSLVFAPGTGGSLHDTLSGSFRLDGFGDQVVYGRPRQKRTVQGVFVARFDSLARQSPPTMSPDLQRRIMYGGLFDFAIHWMQGIVNPSKADSTKDNAKALAFLNNRWSEAAIIDSVAVGPKAFFVRMHGRFEPIVCVVFQNDSRPHCEDNRPFLKRLFQPTM